MKSKHIKYIAFFILAAITVSCKGHLDIPELELTSQGGKTSIVSDGVDAITFRVAAYGEDVTADAVIKNAVTGELVEGNIFSTTEVGEYTFVATYLETVSDELKIVAKGTDVIIGVDKGGLATDGSEKATFIVTMGGDDFSTDDTLKIKDETTGAYLERESDGYYRYALNGTAPAYFSAELGEAESVNQIRVGQKGFYKRVAILEFTGTWCVNCPDMVTALNGSGEIFRDRSVTAVIHFNDKLAVDYGEYITQNIFKFNTLPSLSLDFVRSITRVETAATLASETMRMVDENRAVCGFAVSSTRSGNEVVLKVSLKSDEAKEYGIAVALLESGVTGYPQLSSQGYDNNYVHNHTLRKFHNDNLYGVDTGIVAAGAEVEREFTFDITGFNADNCSFAIFAVDNRAAKPVVLNAVEYKLGETLDYQYE